MQYFNHIRTGGWLESLYDFIREYHCENTYQQFYPSRIFLKCGRVPLKLNFLNYLRLANIHDWFGTGTDIYAGIERVKGLIRSVCLKPSGKIPLQSISEPWPWVGSNRVPTNNMIPVCWLVGYPNFHVQPPLLLLHVTQPNHFSRIF